MQFSIEWSRAVPSATRPKWRRNFRFVAGGCLLLAQLGAPLASWAQPAVDPAALHSEPTERDWRPPVYPPEAIQAKVEGRVSVAFVVRAGSPIPPYSLKVK
jgi:hypothetical protein